MKGSPAGLNPLGAYGGGSAFAYQARSTTKSVWNVGADGGKVEENNLRTFMVVEKTLVDRAGRFYLYDVL